ncbi:nucleoside triphosphate pyrophosphohydrolase [candidate division KSB1 bacterium]|nr:nucleoside triphosphate pyrophosphohydrolase [candidate division KSB1 bacterium]
MATGEFDRLLKIMKKLRSERGCPWDREQTHRSLRPYLLEEVYEVLESIDNERYDELKEELGDLLLHIVFHARIAEETGRFTIKDVLYLINEKLIRRHPHVFGTAKAKDAAQVINQWERIKQAEKEKSVLNGVPRELSSLIRAHRVQEKAAGVGFEWDDIKGVIEKLDEELAEFKAAYREKDQAKLEEEFGDLLFSLVNLSRFLGLSAEDSLRMTIDKFIRRFKRIEVELKKSGKDIRRATLGEMDEIWNRIKKTV